jgi:hypothetical protein
MVVEAIFKFLVSTTSVILSCSTVVHLHIKRSFVRVALATKEDCACHLLLKPILQLRNQSLERSVGKW